MRSPAAGPQACRQHRHQRIVPQFIMVVEIFVAERNAKDPLSDQRLDRMLDQVRAAMIAKASCKAPHQIDRSIGGAQKQRSSIRRHQPSIKGASTARPSTTPKSNRSALHSVRIEAFLESSQSPSRKRTFADSRPDAPQLREKCGLAGAIADWILRILGSSQSELTTLERVALAALWVSEFSNTSF